MSSGPALLVATGNPGKLAEFQAILAQPLGELDWRTLAEHPEVRLPPEGTAYAPNAETKARHAAVAAGLVAVADDSGLEVRALGDAPGPLSARYGGPGLDDAGRVAHLLAELAARPDAGGAREARFVCVAAVATPSGEIFTARGECPGRILSGPVGEGGFGYDPVFQPDGHTASMAELPAATKDALSHRGRALAALLPALRACLGIASPARERA